MERSNLIKSPEYWISHIQIELYNLVINYMKKNNLSKKQLKKKLDLTTHQLKKIFKGEFNGNLSSLVNILAKLGYVPSLSPLTLKPLTFDDCEILCMAENLNRNQKSLNSEIINLVDEHLSELI